MSDAVVQPEGTPSLRKNDASVNDRTATPSFLRKQIVQIITFTTIAALILTCTAFTLWDYLSLRRGLIANVNSLANILCANTATSILQLDSEAAVNTIQSLSGDPRVLETKLFTADGKLLAHYARTQHLPGAPLGFPHQAECRMHNDSLRLSLPVENNHAVIGWIAMRIDNSEITRNFMRHALISLGILLLASTFALVLALRLQSHISTPILSLVSTARAIAERKDYTARAKGGDTNDEISVLIHAFNQMLTQIQKDDEELRSIHAGLEQRVRQRTADLETTNQRLLQEISDRKRAQEELQTQTVQLEEALERVRQMQRILMRNERISVLSQMASGIAHDFNNLLTPIMGFSELLVAHLEAVEGEGRALKMARQIFSAGQDAKQIVKRLRLMYQTEAQTDFSRINLAELVNGAIALTRPKWREEMQARDIRIEVITDLKSAAPLWGNESELREVFTNLILNAVDAMPHGGQIKIEAFGDADSVTVKVSDTGSGMTQEQLGHCFEAFFSTKGARGTGLGLSTVKSIILQHRGTIDVHSELGKGTIFVMQFPPCPPESNVAAVQMQSPMTNRSLRILAIDDDIPVLETIESFLLADHHTVERAGSGAEGLERIKASPFDLVITDRAMPDMSGDRVAALVKQTRPGTPVILLTGFGWIMRDKNEIPEGVDLVFSKPVTRAELRAAITQIFPNPKAEA